MSYSRKIANRAGQGLYLDLRGLAFFRVSLGLLVLADLALRVPDLTMFYTDFGVLPRLEHMQAYGGLQSISVYLANGTWWFAGGLFIVHAIAASALILGYRTRWAVAFTWLLLLSLHRRNPMVLQGGDILLRLLLFWAMFLPLSVRWSWDRGVRRRPRSESPQSEACDVVFSGGSVALLVQLIVIYAYGLVLKSGTPWRDGTAVHFALHIDHFATPIAVWLRQYEWLTEWLTYATLAVEAVGPSLLLLSGIIPRYESHFRLAAVGLMVVLHLSFGLGLNLGLFPVISAVSWLVWLPRGIWDRLETFWTTHGRVAGAKTSGRHASSQHAGWLAIILMGYAAVWNNFSVASPPQIRISDKDYTLTIPESGRWLGEVLGLDQQWDMFAPKPFVDDGWFVVAGVDSDGTTNPLFTELPSLSMEKPASVSGMYPSQRWRKYWMNLWYSQNEVHRQRLLDYACRKAKRDGHALENVFMLYWHEPTSPPGALPRPLGCHVLRAQRCTGRALPRSEPLPVSLAQCDSYAWADAVISAAPKVCACEMNDSLCKSRVWHSYSYAVDRYVAQQARGTAFPLRDTVKNDALSAIEALQSCFGEASHRRLH